MSDNVMHNAPDSSRLNSSTIWGSIIIWGFFGIMLVVFAVLFVLALQEEPQASAVDFNRQEASVLAALSPQVSVKAPQEDNFNSVDGTQPVTAGTEIRTSQDGEAVLFSSDGVLTTLEENTRIVLESIDNESQQSRLQLLAGSLWSRIGGALTGDESYEVQAANVVTSVRGTEFGLSVDGDSNLSVTTLRDEVAVQPMGVATDTLSILSGERVELPSTAGTQLATTGPDTLSAEEIRDIIDERTEVDQRLSDPQLQEVAAVMDGVPTLAASEDQQQASGLERFSESVYTTLFVSDQSERVRDNVLRAQERLQEARANIEDPAKLEAVLQNYRRVIRRTTQQAAESGSSDLQRLVANATRQHQDVLSDLMNEAADPARSVIRGVQSAAQAGHKQAINALASTSPKAAYEEGTRTMKSRLRSVQREAAAGNNLDVRNALREYDDIMQTNAKVSNAGGSSTQANFAGELRKSLSVISTVERFGPSLAPGIRRAMNEVEDRTADTQLASIAAIATSSPQQAVDVYDKTASLYLDRLERSSSSEEVAENAEVYNKYASFAEDVSRSVSDGAADTSSLQQRFRDVADRQLENLERVQQQVPESARNAIQEAIDRQRQAREPDALPSDLNQQEPPTESERSDLPANNDQPQQQADDQRPDEPDDQRPGQSEPGTAPNQGQGQGADTQQKENDLDDYLQEVRNRSPQGNMESLQDADNTNAQPDNDSTPSDSQPNDETPDTQQNPDETPQPDTQEQSTDQNQPTTSDASPDDTSNQTNQQTDLDDTTQTDDQPDNQTDDTSPTEDTASTQDTNTTDTTVDDRTDTDQTPPSSGR